MIAAFCPEPLQVLHPLVNGKPAPECIRSWFGTACPHHASIEKKKARPQLCALQRCESSGESNMLERARDSWDGTAEVNARGFRHFGNADLGVFIFTVPEELRALCVEARTSQREAHKKHPLSALRDFRKAAAQLAIEVLRRHVGNERAEFFAKAWMHPEGDKQPGLYLPHENVLVPLAYYDPGKREGHRIGRCQLPRSYLGADGWVGDRWRELLVSIFGQWWTGAAPVVNWFYEWKSTPEKKIHALKYFPRTFPGWAGHPEVRIRPRAVGLAHWKKRTLSASAPPGRPWKKGPDGKPLAGPGARTAPSKDWLSSVLAKCGEPLPRWDECKECVKAGEVAPPKVAAVGATSAMAEERLEAAVRAHSCGDCQAEAVKAADSSYVQLRRSMRVVVGSLVETGPPSTADPPPEWVNLETGELVVGTFPGPSWRRYAQ